MKALKYILWCLMLLAFFACGHESQCVSPEAMDQAQSEYQSGFECLQADDLNEAFPFMTNVLFFSFTARSISGSSCMSV